MKGIEKFPNLYGYLYRKTYGRNALSKTLTGLFSTGMRKTLRMLETIRPSVIVSTYPFASSMISKLKEYGLTDIPLVTVITDHTHHSSWLQPVHRSLCRWFAYVAPAVDQARHSRPKNFLYRDPD
ncbi:1,2-diacylglycerol 3-glucosyltransferase [Heyndrickxia coagulans]|nr:1,2-diacylglycerol 3-glucosyltransferase [Heyndrickxia coagulans]